MKKINITIDDNILRCSEQVAADHGTDIENMVKSYLKHLATNKEVVADAGEFARLAREKGGRSHEGYKFNRDEIHRREEL